MSAAVELLSRVRAVGPACPLFLDDPDAGWRVLSGTLDVYAVRLDAAGQRIGPGRFVVRLVVGQVAAGTAPLALSCGGCLQLSARGSDDTHVAALGRKISAEEVQTWGTALGSNSGAPANALGSDAVPRSAEDLLAVLALEWDAEDASRVARLDRSRTAASTAFRGGLGQIAAVVLKRRERAAAPVATDPVSAALMLVAAHAGIALRPHKPVSGSIAEQIEAALLQAGVPSRRLRLTPGWERAGEGPIVGLIRSEADREPVAVPLLPLRRGYEFVDPSNGARVRVAGDAARLVMADAWVLFRPLPNLPLSMRGLLRFGMAGGRGDLGRIVGAGLVGALLGLALPIATAPLFTDVLPRADMPSFAVILIAMAVATLAQSAFHLVRGFATLRLDGRMETEVQAALWDRLLRLPTDFFRQYSTGELADRVTGVTAIRTLLSTTITASVMDAAFALASFLPMCWWSGRLTLVALGFSVVAAGLMLVVMWSQAPFQRAATEQMGRLSGLSLQMLNGAAKLRAAGAEARLFARWSELFASQKGALFASRRRGVVQGVLSQILNPVSIMVVFAGVMWLGPSRPDGSQEPLLSIGAVISFNTAFAQFIAGLTALVASGAALVTLLPLLARIRPLLHAVPEVSDTAEPPGELTGDVEFQNVSFRYSPGGGRVLDGVTFRIRPGQHVAIVGPSGSGKSTILRLLLGFERPEAGAVLLNGKDLATLDLQQVRRQAGVVLQHGALLPGSLFENIAGGASLALEDAWAAARMAGLDETIKAMPMGMHTVVSDGGGGLSGGQRQRLLIARALARRPRLVMFDEATSALDNRTQAIVNAGFDKLDVTRVVVAHRLSTVRCADRILVMQDGRLAEDGTFDELIAAGGLFAELARRQQV